MPGTFVQLRRIRNGHPHIVHTYGIMSGSSGSTYIFQERAVCDLHDAAGSYRRRVMGETLQTKTWLLQTAQGESSNTTARELLVHADTLIAPKSC